MTFNIIFNGAYNVYNIGGNESCNILTIAKLIGDKLQVPVTVNSNNDFNGLQGAPTAVKLDMSRYNTEFNITYNSNTLNINNGIDKVINWFKLLI